MLGRELARPDEPFHVGLLPARAAEYEQKLQALFPSETIEVRVTCDECKGKGWRWGRDDESKPIEDLGEFKEVYCKCPAGVALAADEKPFADDVIARRRAAP